MKLAEFSFRIKRKINIYYRRCARFIISLHKRDKSLIVYGGALDLFIDNAKHLFIYNNETMPTRRHVWLSNNDDVISQVRNLGFEAIKSSSWEGKRMMLNAGMVIYDNRIDEFSEHTLSQGAIRLELWHGVPYCKRIGKAKVNEDTPYVVTSKFKYKYLMEHVYGDYVLSPAKKSNVILSAAFEVPEDKLIISDYPRCRFMFMKDEQISEYIYKYENTYTQGVYEELQRLKDIKKVIYMPTFRDADRNYITKAIPDWDDFNHFCFDNNIIFYVKVHRVTPLPKGRDYSNIRFLDSFMDIYPVLGQFDILVTDYSSIMYEFALMKKPVVLYTFDMNEYISQSREIHQEFIDMIEKLDNADVFSGLKNLLMCELASLKKFPSKGYFDCQGSIDNLSLYITNNTIDSVKSN